MSKIILEIEQSEGFSNEVRMTDDGRYSVIDIIRFCGNKSPGKKWATMVKNHPDLLEKTDNFKFPGPGQRETPVAGRENLLYIIGLLPGSIGRAYREEAAKVFLQFIDASPELAESIIDRATPEDLKRIEERLKGKKIRITFTNVLQRHGVTEGFQYAECTNAMYRPLLGGNAKDLKTQMGLTAKENLREHLDSFELAAVSFGEALATRNIEKSDAFGFRQCRDIAEDAGRKVRKTFDD